MTHKKMIIKHNGRDRIFDILKHPEDNKGVYYVGRMQVDGEMYYENIPAGKVVERTYLKAK